MSQPMTGPDNVQKPKRKWYKKKPSLVRFVIWNILCWCFGSAALLGGILYTEHIVRPIAAAGGDGFTVIDLLEKGAAGKRVFGARDRLNVLILGIDYNHDEKGIIFTKGARSDTMMVMSMSREAGFLNVVSIPRDTQVLISEDHGYAKINDAFSVGGVEQARETVSEFLGIPIHHHVIVKVSGAKDVIDALGGLPIDVEKNMDYDDNWGKLHIHLKEGPQILDGEQAVGYARFRMDEEGDRGRMRRQQQVVRALGRRLKEPALLARLDDLARVVQQSIDTDFNLLQMIDLANLYSEFEFAKMRSASIVGDDAMDAYGTSYILPYEPENRRTVRRLLQNLDLLAKDDLRIRIYFKKCPSYLAYSLADRLYDAGFRGVQVEALAWDDETTHTEETRLIWYNEVPRLKGVVRAVVGAQPSDTGIVPEGRDDDMAIFLGDDEQGDWAEIPEKLLKERQPESEDEENLEDERPEIRYQPEFTPRVIPQSDEAVNEPYATPEHREPIREERPEESARPEKPAARSESSRNPGRTAEPSRVEEAVVESPSTATAPKPERPPARPPSVDSGGPSYPTNPPQPVEVRTEALPELPPPPPTEVSLPEEIPVPTEVEMQESAPAPQATPTVE